MIYNITVYNDMGHFMFFDSKIKDIPDHIMDFIHSKQNLYVDTENTKEGAHFYYLKPGLDKKFTYYCNNDVVNITYELDLRGENPHILTQDFDKLVWMKWDESSKELKPLKPSPAGESCTCS